MRTVILKSITFSVLIISGGYCQADTNVKKVSDNDLPTMKLKVDNSAPTNPNLKKGKGCEDLEEAKGEEFADYPMAKTMPCDQVDCKNLKPAVLENDNYKELPIANTEGSCDE